MIELTSYLSNYQPRQSHAGDGANQLDCGAIVNVAIPHFELFTLCLRIIQKVDRKCSPMSAGGLKVSIFHMEVASAHGLGTKPVEKCNLGSRGNAY